MRDCVLSLKRKQSLQLIALRGFNLGSDEKYTLLAKCTPFLTNGTLPRTLTFLSIYSLKVDMFHKSSPRGLMTPDQLHPYLLWPLPSLSHCLNERKRPPELLDQPRPRPPRGCPPCSCVPGPCPCPRGLPPFCSLNKLTPILYANASASTCSNFDSWQ